MKVGVPTEIKTDEYRVALTPSGVRELRASWVVRGAYGRIEDREGGDRRLGARVVVFWRALLLCGRPATSGQESSGS